jgi:hypothetical protein
MSITIKLEGMGPRHFEKTITVSTKVSTGESTVCEITIDGSGAELYPKELDKLIEALTIVKNHTT